MAPAVYRYALERVVRFAFGRLSAGAVAPLLVFTQFSHVVFELPVDQGEPNLLGVESPLLGVLSAGISLALSAALLATIVSLLVDARRGLASPTPGKSTGSSLRIEGRSEVMLR